MWYEKKKNKPIGITSDTTAINGAIDEDIIVVVIINGNTGADIIDTTIIIGNSDAETIDMSILIGNSSNSDTFGVIQLITVKFNGLLTVLTDIIGTV